MATALPANVNLIQLLAASPGTTIAGTEPLESVQTGTSVAFTVNQVLSFVQSNFSAGNLASISGLSVLGVIGTANATPAAIAGTTDQVLRVAQNGTTFGFGAINLATSAAVTGILPGANFSAVNLATTGAGAVQGVLPLSNGGVGTTTLTTNGVLFGRGTTVPGITAQGGTNTVLTANATTPIFTTTPIITNVFYNATNAGSGGKFSINVTANGTAGIAILSGTIVYRDETVGGCALVLYDSGTPTIVTQTGSNFTTSDPGAASSKLWLKSGGDIENRYGVTHGISYLLFGTGPTFV